MTREDRCCDLLAAISEELDVPLPVAGQLGTRSEVYAKRALWAGVVAGHAARWPTAADRVLGAAPPDWAGRLRRHIAGDAQCSLDRYEHYVPDPLDAAASDGAHIEQHPAHPPRAEV